jgi:hypothetical protein
MNCFVWVFFSNDCAKSFRRFAGCQSWWIHCRISDSGWHALGSMTHIILNDTPVDLESPRGSEAFAPIISYTRDGLAGGTGNNDFRVHSRYTGRKDRLDECIFPEQSKQSCATTTVLVTIITWQKWLWLRSWVATRCNIGVQVRSNIRNRHPRDGGNVWENLKAAARRWVVYALILLLLLLLLLRQSVKLYGKRRIKCGQQTQHAFLNMRFSSFLLNDTGFYKKSEDGW